MWRASKVILQTYIILLLMLRRRFANWHKKRIAPIVDLKSLQTKKKIKTQSSASSLRLRHTPQPETKTRQQSNTYDILQLPLLITQVIHLLHKIAHEIHPARVSTSARERDRMRLWWSREQSWKDERTGKQRRCCNGHGPQSQQ